MAAIAAPGAETALRTGLSPRSTSASCVQPSAESDSRAVQSATSTERRASPDNVRFFRLEKIPKPATPEAPSMESDSTAAASSRVTLPSPSGSTWSKIACLRTGSGKRFSSMS